MKPRAAATSFSCRMLTTCCTFRLDWLIALLFLVHVGSAHGQSIGAVSARQEGETIVISVSELTNVEVEELTYFYSMDSGKNWIEIAKDCLEFEGEDARWAVLDCMNKDAFSGSAIRFKVNFATCSPVRFDGYEYKVVEIGSQCWFAENLRTSVYANGDAIRGNLGDSEWSETNSGAQAIYDNSKYNLEVYGRLYNWYAVDDSRGLCPVGWHVPSDREWTELTDCLGGTVNAGSQMKSSALDTPHWNGLNIIGFLDLPGGQRHSNGSFYFAGYYGYWWSSSPYSSVA